MPIYIPITVAHGDGISMRSYDGKAGYTPAREQ